jgi:hypothetical protein
LYTVKEAKSEYSSGNLDLQSRQDMLKILSCEGHKRLESFIFEPILNEYLTNCVPEGMASQGWSFQLDNAFIPKYWFKLVTDQKFNKCDKEFCKFLHNAECIVVIVWYSEKDNFFLAKKLINKNEWSEIIRLEDLLFEINTNKAPSDVLNYSNIDTERQNSVIEYFSDNFSDVDLRNLCVSRIFTNFYLYPYFRKQPMDIDSCCLVDSQLRFIEFKRKYPAKNGDFGIDEIPHGKLIDWLSKNELKLTHIILSDPRWNKEASPITLVQHNSKISKFIVWLATELDSDSFESLSMSTYGSDSGMFSGKRSQRTLKVDNFYVIGTGLHPSGLRDYLFGRIGKASIELLIDAKEKAAEQKHETTI